MLFLPRFTPPNLPQLVPEARICPICTFAVTPASGWVEPWGPNGKVVLHADCAALCHTLILAAPAESAFLADVVRARELARKGVRHAPDALAMRRALRAKRKGDLRAFNQLVDGRPFGEVKDLIREAGSLSDFLAALADEDALEAHEWAILNEQRTAERRVAAESMFDEPLDPEQDAKDQAARDAYYGDLGVVATQTRCVECGTPCEGRLCARCYVENKL